MKNLITWLAVFTVFLITPVSAQSRFSLKAAFPEIVFDRPIDFQAPKGVVGDPVYVVEQSGKIWRVSGKVEAATRELFLDISELVSRDGGERGLLGAAFHPQFASNGWLFVNYTRKEDGATVISRIIKNGNTFDELKILTVEQPFENHNAGGIVFGNDGFLYVPLGDGGSGGDPQNNSQNLKVLLGKVLRIDISQSTEQSLYAIPDGNPFKGNKNGVREEIFSSGVRNPFKTSVDPRTGKIWFGDVGQGRREEVNIVRRKGNFGWNKFEGPLCYPSGEVCSQRGFVKPVWSYGRNAGSSITGGYVYRGSKLKSLFGEYVYGDFISGTIWALKKNSDGSFRNRRLLRTSVNISSFGVDQAGEIFVVGYDGRVFGLEG